VRVKQWLDGFGTNGVLESICAPDFRPAMLRIAQVISRALGAQCVPTNIARKADGSFDCDVTQRTFSTSTPPTPIDMPVPACDAGRTVTPCWEFGQSTQCQGNTQLLTVCYEPQCMVKPTVHTDALISCTVTPP
jgi:hypothetical protein